MHSGTGANILDQHTFHRFQIVTAIDHRFSVRRGNIFLQAKSMDSEKPEHSDWPDKLRSALA